MRIEDGAEISSSTLGSGSAGTINIDVFDSATVKGVSPVDAKPSQVIAGGNIVEVTVPFPLNLDRPLGAAGNIVINTPSLQIFDGAKVTAQNSGANNAGNLEINSGAIVLDGGQISASTASGQGGNIVLNTENLELIDQSQITASAGGSGNGGNITIDSDLLLV